ncbi:MAG: alpha-amylase family glycosyl hydrolase [Odoribacter sp.]
MKLEVKINDPLLEPYLPVIRRRAEQNVLKELEFTDGRRKLSDVFNNHLYFGLHHEAEGGWTFREWAPSATAMYMVGDMSGWKRQETYRMKKLSRGVWELQLPEEALERGMKYKLWIFWEGGGDERLPAYVHRAVQDEETKIFSAEVWDPETPYEWRNPRMKRVSNPLIYEAHVGIATEDRRVSTFQEFRLYILPRIANLGYTVVQLMGLQEHPYYASFGYQISNFYAVSSRFGTPDDLKELVDAAHGYGIAVVMDLVQSHAVRNEKEGLSCFAGDYNQYFYPGERGKHPLWDSRCFDYGKNEVIGFLLSNCKYWLEEFHLDGFRFDGITSVIYWDHGIHRDFTSYACYYDGNEDEAAITYLTLANRLIHEVNPEAITIAEDVSGMPGLGMAIEEGGMGFDFRMSMGTPECWMKLVKYKPDELWKMEELYYELTNKREDEHTISYVECHDQAIVGNLTLFFRMLQRDIYTSMVDRFRTLKVERGMSLHMMIRLLTLTTAGDGYLTFMGNEFGHPEWIDLPRKGNLWSYEKARRLWSLVDDQRLLFHFLNDFDRAMIALVKSAGFLVERPQLLVVNEEKQLLIIKRKDYIFVFNFSPQRSYAEFVFAADPGKYQMVLNTDSHCFNGGGRLVDDQEHFTMFRKGGQTLCLYIPTRIAMVLRKID